jgi:hypothetical protein
MVPVLVPTDDARAHQGYCCSIRRLNRYCRPVDLLLPPIVASLPQLLPVVASTTMEPTMWGCR